MNATNLTDGQEGEWGDACLACGLKLWLRCRALSAWVFWLWCDGEVLRHSAALSCWHRKRAGWAVHRRPESGWITTGLVRFGLDRQLHGQWLHTEGGSYSAMEPLAAWGLVGRSTSLKQETTPLMVTRSKIKWGFMRCTYRHARTHTHTHSTHTHVNRHSATTISVMAAPWTPAEESRVTFPQQLPNILVFTEKTTNDWEAANKDISDWCDSSKTQRETTLHLGQWLMSLWNERIAWIILM